MLPNKPFDTFVHTRLIWLLIIYCLTIVNYGKQMTKKLSNGVELPSLASWSVSAVPLGPFLCSVLDTFAANQLSDIPFEARQAASIWEMLRLISCHKPNDKTYICTYVYSMYSWFLDLLPQMLSCVVVVAVLWMRPSVIIVIMFIYGVAGNKN